MMTQELEVSILSGPLAAIDRRELSQAWYSALHMAQRSPGQRASGQQPLQREPMRSSRAMTLSSLDARTAQPSAQTLVRAPEHRVSSGDATIVDPAPAQRVRTALSRRIQLRFAASEQRTTRATFTLGRGRARVHVIMQSNGATARLIAICRPQMRDVVARALSEARLALRARGVPVATAPACSRITSSSLSAFEAEECL